MKNKHIPGALQQEHLQECHARWIKNRNNYQEGQSPEPLPDEWYNNQCGGCLYYIPLQGLFSADWGVCSNAASPCDGTARFEHDGCEHFEGAPEWISYLMKQLS